MADMLVKLYDLPDAHPTIVALREVGIEIRQTRLTERRDISVWVGNHFSADWAVSAEVAASAEPSRCFIAVRKKPHHISSGDPYDVPPEEILGFACYDATAKGMFGPVGVREDSRVRGVGKALLLSCLHAMSSIGYAYAVIGWVGPVDFYERTVGATVIPDSAPGVYRGDLVDSFEEE
jgi:hypothetical protein